MVNKLRKLKGTVFSGLGKGAFFVSLDEYKDFFCRLLGKEPYPGTLNIRLQNCSWHDLFWYGKFKPKNGFGAIYYSIGQIEGETIVVIRPVLSRHDDNVVEIVATNNLRKKLNLKDGDEISIFLKMRD